MVGLIVLIISSALLAGFLALTSYETARGIRLYAPLRERLDRTASRIEFIVSNVNFAGLVKEEVQHIAERIGHDSVHFSLILVRAVERTLTRLVRYLREREAATSAPRENVRAFVKTLSDFKDGLNAEHPKILLDSSEI